MLPLNSDARTEHEIVTDAVNKILSSRCTTPISYFRNYMTAEENMLWPNVRTFVRDVEVMIKLTTN